MSNRANNVKPLPGAHQGNCFVCGKHVLLTHGCVATGKLVGQCCRAALIFADDMLSLHGPRTGICHPKPDNYSAS